jgi:raffinose/stachyose/melibiose transport system permease protein
VNSKKIYSAWFLVPSLTIFGIFFLVPLITSLFFSLTVWDFKSYTFVGLKNFRMFFSERSLSTSISHTLVYAFMTSGLKVVIAFLIAVFLTSGIKTQNLLRSVVFFPNLVSTIAVGITFAALMHPTKGLFNTVLTSLGLGRIDFLGNPDLALFSVIFTDVWKGVSVATIIYIAGIQSIDRNYYEAASIDGAGKWQKLVNITMPLIRPAMNSVIILSLIGGLRCFDLIWSMTGGGPGFATDVLASVIYKEYAAGFYGLSTAGNIIMFVLIAVIAYPLQRFLLRKEDT